MSASSAWSSAFTFDVIFNLAVSTSFLASSGPTTFSISALFSIV
jgi:hypothetical protein